MTTHLASLSVFPLVPKPPLADATLAIAVRSYPEIRSGKTVPVLAVGLGLISVAGPPSLVSITQVGGVVTDVEVTEIHARRVVAVVKRPLI
jgi:hypothetical protein